VSSGIRRRRRTAKPFASGFHRRLNSALTVCLHGRTLSSN